MGSGLRAPERDHLDARRRVRTISAAQRLLLPGGWLYVTDVNPYFAMLLHPYASFQDEHGLLHRVRVYPHSIPQVIASFQEAGFSVPSIREIKVTGVEADAWPELRNLRGFPLILEYFVRKR